MQISYNRSSLREIIESHNTTDTYTIWRIIYMEITESRYTSDTIYQISNNRSSIQEIIESRYTTDTLYQISDIYIYKIYDLWCKLRQLLNPLNGRHHITNH